MTAPDNERRRLAAGYLRGRMLEEALAAWRWDYDAPTYRERCLIGRLAADAETQ